jgi:hypothetical protein
MEVKHTENLPDGFSVGISDVIVGVIQRSRRLDGLLNKPSEWRNEFHAIRDEATNQILNHIALSQIEKES